MQGDVRRVTDLSGKVPTSTSLAECWYFVGAILSRTQLSVRFSPKRTLSLGELVNLERLESARSGHSNSADVLIHSDTNPLYSTAITRTVVSPTFSAQWAVTGPTHRG